MPKNYKKEVENMIKEVDSTFRILAVTGPRQVGKSTILENLKSNDRTKITLDDRTIKAFAENSPKMFIETSPLFIDEIEYAPELFVYLKIKVDNDKARGQYWLSGS